MSDHYVYTLAYPDERVFYVGQGTNGRIDAHEKEAQYSQRSTHKLNTIRKIWANGGQVVKRKLAHFATYEEACLYEIALIFFMDGLTNQTYGGEGVVGLSEEGRQKIGAVHKGRVHSLEHRQKRSQATKGRPGHPLAPAVLLKISETRKLRANPWRSLSEAARRVGVSQAKLSRMVKQGKIKIKRDPKDERKTLVDLNELNRYFYPQE